MSQPTTTAVAPERPHAKASKPGLANVGRRPDDRHEYDDDTIKELANMIALGDRDAVFAIAGRLVGYDAVENVAVPRLLSVEQIAMCFNLCTRSVWRLVSKGELPHPILVGSARRWYASDIAEYLTKQTEKRDGRKPRKRG